MLFCTSSCLFSLAFLLRGVAAFLPYGCGGTLGILSITAPSFNSLVWTCAKIVPESGFQGATILVSTPSAADVSSCGNKCAAEWYLTPNLPDGLGATGALWFSDNSTCECWFIGDGTGDLVAATDESDSATYIDFLNGFGAPSSSKDWGIFTCPEGSNSLIFMSDPSWAECDSLTVTPAGPPIAEGGAIGGMCGGFCANNYDVQYALIEGDVNCYCYNDLAGLKYYFNFTSSFTVVDIYDFRTPTSTLTSQSSSTSTIKLSSTSKSSSSKTSSTTHKSSSSKTSSTIHKSSSIKSSSTKSSSISKKYSISTSKTSSTTHKSTSTIPKSTSKSSPTPKITSTSTRKLPTTTFKSTSTTRKATSTSK